MPRFSLSFAKKFIRCGIAGWCMEILFTSLHSLRRRDLRLVGNTSVWMFPIYGCAAFLGPVCRLLKGQKIWFRGITYMSLIFSAEYLTGHFLKRHKLCPWDYSHSRWNIGSLIRLDYAPVWFLAGLLFEHILSPKLHNTSANERSVV